MKFDTNGNGIGRIVLIIRVMMTESNTTDKIKVTVFNRNAHYFISKTRTLPPTNLNKICYMFL